MADAVQAVKAAAVAEVAVGEGLAGQLLHLGQVLPGSALGQEVHIDEVAAQVLQELQVAGGIIGAEHTGDIGAGHHALIDEAVDKVGLGLERHAGLPGLKHQGIVHAVAVLLQG